MNENAVRPTEPIDSRQGKTPRWLWLGCWLLVIAAGLHSANHIVGGGDTWVAMACGRYTVGPWAAGQEDRTWQMHVLDKFGLHLTKQDPFGAKTRPFIPGDKKQFGWVNQNWLTHVLFYEMRENWGENAIVFYKFLQAVLTVCFMYAAARALGVHAVIAAAAVVFGILLSRSFVDLRPNVTTILFSSIMIYLLCRWRKGHPRSLLWMIPLMILWSNVHGGFIYPIMIFVIFTGVHIFIRMLSSIGVPHLVQPGQGALKWLFLTTVLVIFIPGVFSPFGLENLTHPFIVALGQEGKIWRDVIEWRPLWQPGFGNIGPYLVFLVLFGLVLVLWGSLFLFSRPASGPGQKAGRRRRHISEERWPLVDLAHLGVIAITLYMSVTSRRFVFLGGVVLSVFLARMIQEIIDMVRLYRASRDRATVALNRMPKRWTYSLAGLALAAGLVMSGIFVLAMRDIYFSPPADGEQMTVFRRMVGIHEQPVLAMKFIDDNNIQGVVLNEWTDGGYVAFGQKPDPQTGRPLCKPFMDGRAQAAYSVEHFLKWRDLQIAIPDRNPQAVHTVHELGKKLQINSQGNDFYHRLVEESVSNKPLRNQLLQLAHGDPQLYIELKRKKLENVIKAYQLDSNDPLFYEKLVQRYCRDDPFKEFHELASFSVADTRLYDHLLQREGVNVAMLSHKGASRVMQNLLENTGTWKRVYADDRNSVFLRQPDPIHQAFFQQGPKFWQYPDEFTRLCSLGLYYCDYGSDEQKKEGLNMLLQVQDSMPLIYENIVRYGLQLGMLKEVLGHFLERVKAYRKPVDSGQAFGRLKNVNTLLMACDKVTQILQIMKRNEQAGQFQVITRQYRIIREEIVNDLRNGLLW